MAFLSICNLVKVSASGAVVKQAMEDTIGLPKRAETGVQKATHRNGG